MKILLVLLIFICGCASIPDKNDSFFEDTMYIRSKYYYSPIPITRKEVITKQEYRMLPSYAQEAYERQ